MKSSTIRGKFTSAASFTICFVLLASILTQSVDAQTGDDIIFFDEKLYPEIWEQVVYENNVLNDKGFAYYQMTISERYFNGTQSLVIKALPEQFDSDPDIFISKNNTKPSNSLNSQWFCVKHGADTCIINRNSINIGDTFYIGVRCINPCQYTLASNWAPVTRVSSNNRTQYRLEGFSSTILEYLVPSTNPEGLTRAVYMSVEPEKQYSPIDLYFSLDSTIYQVEERKVENILSNGAGYSFTENDNGWCTGCFIYLLVDVIEGGRYYISFLPSPRDRTLRTIKSTDIMINARQQECSLYFIQSANNDVLLYSYGYQGDTDLYISGSTRPSDNQDTRRILQIAQRVPQKAILVTVEDRVRWGIRTGVMNVCLYGFDTSSTNVKTIEENLGGRVDAEDGIYYTFNLERNNSRSFRFTQRGFNTVGNISVTMTNHNLTSNQVPARLFYTICGVSDPLQCYLNDTQRRGQGMIELAAGNVNVQNGNTRTARVVHNPRNCRNPNKCYYIFLVFYPDQVGPVRTSFQVLYNHTDYHAIKVTQKYRNIIPQGSYFNYALLQDATPGSPFLKGLTIKLENVIGDADLVVSVTVPNPEINQNQLETTGLDRYDSITLNKTGNFSLNRPIYIAIYAQTFAVYTLSFEPTYELEYDAKLTMARPIRDSIAYYNYYLQETEESFYSFTPWWAGQENRTVIFFADVIFNNIFFYMMANDYPQFYLTEYKDKNDIIVLNPGDSGYSLQNTYYIRIRPDFQLQDLISRRQYIFNFFAFTQVQPGVFSDIHLNELRLGYANRTNMYYRHFIIENNATYNFSVIPIIGNPALLLKLSNTEIQPQSANVLSWDFKSDQPGKQRDSIVVTLADRSGRYAFCERAGFNLNGGNRSCGFYLAVECQTECIYNITVQIVGRERQALPKYLVEGDYYTGQVSFNQYSYFYYPLSRGMTGEMVIILNKTAPLGQNGDAMLLGSLMADSANFRLENWTYPTTRNYSFASSTGRSSQPEIVELCSQVINTRCQNGSCILMLGVLGLTPDVTANFRILVHRERNKLQDRNPVRGFISEVGKYDYYWFTSNYSLTFPRDMWEFTITTSVERDGQDVDLYVSALDGRFPTSDDYDFASDNLGPDDIYINSNNAFFEEAGYNRTNGFLFVVGVKALTPNASYTLMMTGPIKQVPTITNLTTGIQQQRTLVGTRANQNTDYYKWFNWGSKDFRINIEVSTGNVAVFVNFVGEEVFQTNGFMALPQNVNNSKWTVYLSANQAGVLRVTKEDIGGDNLFCYFCWYFFTVTTNATGNTVYRIAVNEVPDVGEEVMTIPLNTSQSFTLPATGTVTQRKFIVLTKDPFEIQATVTMGYLVMYVGLYPNSPLNKFQWRAEGSSRLNVYARQTDQNFRLGAFYYITLQSGQGRTAFQLRVNQYRTIRHLENGLIYKEQYSNMQEQVKLYYFQTPSWRGNYRAVINILSLSEDFYPTVLLMKNTRTAAFTDPDRQLMFPNVRDFNLSFGDNFFAIANQRNVSYFTYHPSQFTYQFRDVGANLTWFTMAIYNFQYGMTDRRKPVFKIQVFFDNRTISQSLNDNQCIDSSASQEFTYDLDDMKEISIEDEIGSDEKAYFKEQTFYDEDDDSQSVLERAGEWVIKSISEVEKQIRKSKKHLPFQ